MDITVKFTDFWPGFDPQHNKFVDALASRHRVTVLADDSPGRPRLLIYSCFGQDHLRYPDAIKVYYSGENDVPDFNECDYALSLHRIDFGGRHMRYPLYMLYEHREAMHRAHISDEAALGRPFCSCVMRNADNCDPRRIAIIDSIAAVGPVAYGGPWRNNVGGPVDEKIPFISGFKFNLALENSCLPGYVTEKILEPYAALTVPIYWGAPDVSLDFNPESYINAADYDTPASLAAAVAHIDADPQAYLAMLRAPVLTADTAVDHDARLADFLCRIAADGHKHTVPYGHMGTMHRRRALMAPVTGCRLLERVLRRLRR